MRISALAPLYIVAKINNTNLRDFSLPNADEKSLNLILY